MKLKHETVTILILIIYVLFCFIASFLLFGKIALQKEEFSKFIIKLDFIEYLKTNSQVTDILIENRIPDEIFDYVDENNAHLLLNNIVDNLYADKETLVNDNNVENLMVESIKRYEKKYTQDIYSHISGDISNVAKDITDEINNFDFIQTFNFLNHMVNGFFPFWIMLILLVLIIVMFCLEKENALFLIGVSNVSISAIIVYVSKSISEIILSNKGIMNCFGNETSDYLIGKLNPVFTTLAILGLIMLVIYLLIYLHQLIIKFRIKYYDKYYGS